MLHNRKGFGTLDVIFALGIMGLMIGAYARQEAENYSYQRADSIATSVSSVMDATKFYIGNNYNALLSHLDVGQSMEIPLVNDPSFLGIGDLSTNSALLPSGFTGKIAKGQTIHLVLKHIAPTAGKPDYISGMVMTTGGANLTDREVGLAVNDMGLSGGGVMSKPPIGHTSASVYGGYGTWSYPASQWQIGGFKPEVGHIAMVTDSFALPTGDYLSRYNGSNPEGIRMHTDLDMGNGEGMSGNQLNGVHAIFGANNQDTRLQDTYHSGRVNFGNGGMACGNDSMGCHFDIGTKGGFYDNEDGWISFQNNSPTLGLKNSNTTDVLGATLDNDILTKDGVSYSFSAGGAPGQAQDAALTYGGGWINATGGSGFQGISAYLMQARRFQDRADNSYYFVPSQLSRLNELQLAGKMATNDYDINAGFNQGVPALGNVPSLMAGGLVTYDAYAEGGLYNGNSDGHTDNALMANGNGYLSGLLKVNQNIHARGTISTDGLDASNPQAWDSLSNSGGVHTTALKSSGGSIFIGSNYNGYAGSGLWNLSKAEVSGIAKASVFRTMGFHPTAGTSCTGYVIGHSPDNPNNQFWAIWNPAQVKDNTPRTYQNGDIAADASGRPLSCVNGVWKSFSNMLFSTFNGCNTVSQWTNTTSKPEFVSAYSNTSDSESNTISMYLISPQGTSYLISSSENPSDRGSKRYAVDGFVPNGWSARVDTRFGVAGVCHWGSNSSDGGSGSVPNPVDNTTLPTPTSPPDNVNLIIAQNTRNYDVRSHMISELAWNQTDVLNVNIIVDPGVVVGSTSTGAYSLTINNNFPTGTTFTLVNNGYIVGAGGRGGDASWSNVMSGPGDGSPGGPALFVGTQTAITNNGIIGGGGGGGGGAGLAGGRTVHEYGGGGGAGDTTGNGGVGYLSYWHGHSGSLLTGGHSGAWGQVSGGNGGCTGDNDLAFEGGDLGQPGKGNPCYAIGKRGNGGAGGHAVDGASLVTWTLLGDVLGTQQ